MSDKVKKVMDYVILVIAGVVCTGIIVGLIAEII